MDDRFDLYTLKVEVVDRGYDFVCSHRLGDYFLVEGENLIFQKDQRVSMYALAALLPLLPAKQRELHQNDWMLSDAVIACPDPHCGAGFKISRLDKKSFSHAETTVVPLDKENQ